ncbi:SusC/RagA family TonB-linked outer membrane protein [Mucilaginibacter pineti]|nr:SusC/RagA family TonB-linked outer membrane protein [Mucilaginibacter pineti]
MKLTFVLIVAALLQVHARSFAQNITLNERNISLSKVFTAIKSQTGYDFIYNPQMLDKAKPVSIHLTNTPLVKVLEDCFKDQPVTYTIDQKTIIVKEKEQSLFDKIKNALAIPITISGKVTDTIGTPLPGATVKNITQNTSTITNDNGTFLISALTGDKITVTFIGYNSYVFTVTENLPYQAIILHSFNSKLDEVIVSTGYQDIPKERATGSFYKLDNQLINQRVSPDIISRLDGLTSGLLFDNHDSQQHTIQIHGLSTLNYGSASPLIVLDNFPYAGNINNINPNDIESITILKDAAASSIWGARAGNGVIVITTKKAKANQPLTVNINSNITISPKPNLFSANQMSVNGYIDLEKNLFSQGYYDALFSNPSFPAYSQVVDILNQQRNGQISDSQANQAINQLRGQDVRTDMQKYLYQNSVNQQYYLNLTGSGNNIRYLASAGYDNDLSNLKGNGNNRLTIRSNNIIDLTKKWQLQTDLILTKSNSTANSPGGYGGYKIYPNSISPYARLVNNDGTPAAIDLYYSKAFTDTAGAGKLLDWKYRPLQELQNNNNKSTNTDILLNLGTSYKVFNWLRAEVKYQYEQSWDDLNNLQNLDSYVTRDAINTYTQIHGSAVTYIVPKNAILNSQETINKQQAVRGQLNIDHTWNDKNQFSAIVGSEIRETQSSSIYGMTYGYDPNTLTTTPVDFVNLYPTYDGIYGNTYITNGTRFTKLVNRFVSVFGNASYTYANKYTISASARRDASNIFGVSTNQKWQPLWSTGAMWKIDREKFYNVSWLPELSLRLTYGESGNLSPNESALTKIQYYTASRNPINLPYVGINSPPNPHLSWEQVKTLNIGLDFSSFGNRMNGSFEYYTKHSDDLINGVQLDPTVGFSNARQNSASIFSKGIDLVLNSLNTNGAIKWRSTVLFNYVNYKVVKNLNPPATQGLVSSGTYIFPILNYNPYEIVTYKWAGLNPKTGDPQGYVNGVVSTDYNALTQTQLDQQVNNGSAIPPVFGTIRNTFQWKNFSLAVNITYKLNYYFLRPATNYSNLITSGSGGYSDYDQRWQKPGDEMHTNVPSFIYPTNSQRDVFYQYSSINVEKGDNFKLNDIYFSYDFIPHRKILGFKSLQFYLYANQLNFILWKANKAGIDPDIIYDIKPPVSYSAGIKASL